MTKEEVKAMFEQVIVQTRFAQWAVSKEGRYEEIDRLNRMVSDFVDAIVAKQNN